jgi:hypothetical protein
MASVGIPFELTLWTRVKWTHLLFQLQRIKGASGARIVTLVVVESDSHWPPPYFPTYSSSLLRDKGMYTLRVYSLC